MLIKFDDSELQISREGEVYLGTKKTGQTFRKWSEIDKDTKFRLEIIMQQAENMIKETEDVFHPIKPH
jgi:hypothetical protein